MAKYRKKPVVIEAIQWLGNNIEEITKFIGYKPVETIGYKPVETIGYTTKQVFLTIETLEGQHIASPGDYIIKGVQGEFYPCKPLIFAKTYELVR